MPSWRDGSRCRQESEPKNATTHVLMAEMLLLIFPRKDDDEDDNKLNARAPHPAAEREEAPNADA